MPSSRLLPRAEPDACPGALRVHEAADGALARVRLPGGALRADQLLALAAATEEFGDGRLELTSRANVQVRAIRDVSAFAAAVAAAGLLPSATHERVRNIVASPLGGPEVVGLVAALDARLCARPRLAQLPGRFLFAVDSGAGDTAALNADARVVLAPGRPGADARLGGGDRSGVVEPGGFAVGLDEAADALLAVAEAFLDERAAQGSRAWRIAELVDGPASVAARLAGRWPTTDFVEPSSPSSPSPSPEPLGVIGADVVALVPLGRLTAAQARAVAAQAGAAGVRITPGRAVALPAVDDPAGGAGELAEAGLVLDAGSPWAGVTACAGRPGCASALADVQADARSAVLRGERGVGRVHWSGCERRCGRPGDTEVDLVATGAGYRESRGE